MTDQGVNYTVKELLAAMDQKSDERHRQYTAGINRIERSVSDLRDDVELLKTERTQRQARGAFIQKSWGVGVAGLAVCLQIPAVIFLALK